MKPGKSSTWCPVSRPPFSSWLDASFSMSQLPSAVTCHIRLVSQVVTETVLGQVLSLLDAASNSLSHKDSGLPVGAQRLEGLQQMIECHLQPATNAVICLPKTRSGQCKITVWLTTLALKPGSSVRQLTVGHEQVTCA